MIFINGHKEGHVVRVRLANSIIGTDFSFECNGEIEYSFKNAHSFLNNKCVILYLILSVW